MHWQQFWSTLTRSWVYRLFFLSRLFVVVQLFHLKLLLFYSFPKSSKSHNKTPVHIWRQCTVKQLASIFCICNRWNLLWQNWNASSAQRRPALTAQVDRHMKPNLASCSRIFGSSALLLLGYFTTTEKQKLEHNFFLKEKSDGATQTQGTVTVSEAV